MGKKNRQEKNTTVLILGTGAVGGFYGAKLAQAGARVSVLCRSDYISVKAAGIRIKSPQGDMTFIPDRVLKAIDEYTEKPDYILVALKVLPDIDTAGMIRNVVGKNTSVCLLQNGIGIEEPVARGLPETEIISALAFVCLYRTGPGLIHHQCYGCLTLGKYPSGTSKKTEHLKNLFSSVGIPCQVDENIIQARWRKLVWNSAFNPLSVLAGGVTTAQILALPDTAELVRKIMGEVNQIAAAEGYALEPDIVEQNIEATKKMRPYKTSMLQDYILGRPMETEAILGAPLRIAKQHKLSTPYLEIIYTLLKLAKQRLSDKKNLRAKLMNFLQFRDTEVTP